MVKVKMSKVLAISGFAKSGKDTSAAYLVDKGYRRIAFADILKDMVAEQYDLPIKYMHDQDLKEKPLEQYPVTPKDAFSLEMAKMLYKEFRTIEGYVPMEYHVDASGAFIGVLNMKPVQLYWTPRALCILEGSIKRSVNANYWVDKAIDKAYKLIKEGGKVIITDMRYRSEAAALQQAFGKELKTVRINRFDSSPSTDASERDLDKHNFNVIIENKGTLEELYEKLNQL
jgi:hypothetical protein